MNIAADKDFVLGENQLTVLDLQRGRRAIGEDVQLVRNDRPLGGAETCWRLLAGITATTLPSAHKNAGGARNFGDLASARRPTRPNSASSFVRLPARNSPFKKAVLDVQLDQNAAKKLFENLDGIAKVAKPNDVLVVFFAGHGDLLMPSDGPQPRAGRAAGGEGTFLFCCPDYTPAKPGATAISVDELFAALGEGQLPQARAHRRVPLRTRDGSEHPPPLRAQRSGADRYRCVRPERAVLRRPAQFGHGLFTFAMLNAFNENKDFRKADYNSDGALRRRSFTKYVAAKVPALDGSRSARRTKRKRRSASPATTEVRLLKK